MDKLIIVGAGGSGRETLEWAIHSEANNTLWEILGFLDDNPNALNGFAVGYPILGTIKEWLPRPDERFVVTIGAPKIRKEIVKTLEEKGAIFGNVIHKSAILAKTSSIGNGVIFAPFVVISDNAKVLDHVNLNISTCIGHDALIGEFSTISSHCDITGSVNIGRGTFVGSSSAFVPRISIGENSFIGAGSIVMNNIKPDTKVWGNPAKRFAIKS